MTEREARAVPREQLQGERGTRLLRWLLEHGADEFSIVVMALQETQAPFADAFEDELGPYERSPAPRRVPAVANDAESIRQVRLWALNDESLRRLLGFLDGDLVLCPAGPDGWLEDLAIYRGGELVLGIVSHEQEAVLSLTAAEHDEAAVLGKR